MVEVTEQLLETPVSSEEAQETKMPSEDEANFEPADFDELCGDFMND
jgi:hypothetical protein